MEQILLAPDSFKGTLSAIQVCGILSDAFRSVKQAVTIDALPIADGGEGTVDAFLTACGGVRRKARVTGPVFNPVEACYGLLPDGTAVVEMAAASGLPLAGARPDPLHTTTYGTGELIRHALDDGCKRLLVGLGGSATNDGGCGCAAALGVQFLDAAGQAVPYTGDGLSRLAVIRTEGLDPRLHRIPVAALCDVTNPLCGPEGAAAVFAPQKGADAQAVRRLDENLRRMAQVIRRETALDITTLPGAGAAGGLGGGMVAFLHAQLRPGIDAVLDTARFEDRARTADLIVTGEGRLDTQSLAGKAASGVARRAGQTPVIAIVGRLDATPRQLAPLGLRAVYEADPLHRPLEEVKRTCDADLYQAALQAASDFLFYSVDST